MTTQIIDSDRRCPRDGKLMILEIGQGEEREQRTVMVHSCWHCGYAEQDEAWKRPKVVVRREPTMADQRRGLLPLADNQSQPSPQFQ